MNEKYSVIVTVEIRSDDYEKPLEVRVQKSKIYGEDFTLYTTAALHKFSTDLVDSAMGVVFGDA